MCGEKVKTDKTGSGLQGPKYQLAQVFKRYLGDYLRAHRLSRLQRRVVEAIMGVGCPFAQMQALWLRTSGLQSVWQPALPEVSDRSAAEMGAAAAIGVVADSILSLYLHDAALPEPFGFVQQGGHL